MDAKNARDGRAARGVSVTCLKRCLRFRSEQVGSSNEYALRPADSGPAFQLCFVETAHACKSLYSSGLAVDGRGAGDPEHDFDVLHLASGRSSPAPKDIVQALLLQAFYSSRSEQLLVEQVDYRPLFRWFVGPCMDDAAWNHAAFSKNRDRSLTSNVAQRFFAEGNGQVKKFILDDV